MAINIQEILHPSDSNQIKWEKVNYNFDQILANGGGPAGSKGNKGSQGSVGQTGAKGEKGDQGVKGDPGSTSSRWETITIDGDSNGIAEYVILKPKLESDTYHPVIFLGDQTFDNVNGVNGETRLRSTLTIGHHAEGGNSPSGEFLTFWHGERGESGNNVGITISSKERVDDTGADFTRFKLDETYGMSLNGDAFDPMYGTYAETIEFYVGMDRFVFNTDVSFDSADATFQFPATLRGIDTIKAGMVRYYDGAFQGAVEDSDGNIAWTSFCMAPCGGGGGYVGTISLDDNSNLTVGPDGSQLGSYIEISGGDIDVDLDGDPWNGAATTQPPTTVPPTTVPPTTATQTIAIAGTSWTPSNAIEAGGLGVTLSYEIDGIAGGQILSSAQVTTPTWVTVSTYSGGSNNDQILMEVLPNAGGQRNGTITIAHPNNSNVTDSVGITQASGVTTQTPTTVPPTTVPPTTVIPTYTLSYDANGGSGTGTGPTTGTLPLTVAPNPYNKAGYSFTEWNTMPSGTGSGYAEGASYNVAANDTLYAQWAQDGHTVTYINGNYDSTSTCQLTTNTKTAFYTASSAGNFGVVSAAIMADNDYAGSTGVFCKIVSSTEDNFQWSNHIFNHAYPSGPTNCTNVLATTTTPPTTVDSGSGSGTTTDSGSGSGGSDSGSGSGATVHTVSNYGNYSAYITYTNGQGVSTGVSVASYGSATICAVPGTFGGTTSGSISVTNSNTSCSY